MSSNSKYIRIGFFDNFKGYDTILISADIYGLLEIETAFQQLSIGLHEFDFYNLTLLDQKYRIPIKASVSTKNIGIIKLSGSKFDWILTKDKWNQARKLSTGLYRNSSNGHQYLNSELGDIENESLHVVLSLNEYPLSFWEEHFPSSNIK